MAATAVIVNDLEGHSPVAAFSDAIRRTFVQHFTRFQLTVCSHGSCALAELLVIYASVQVIGSYSWCNASIIPIPRYQINYKVHASSFFISATDIPQSNTR